MKKLILLFCFYFFAFQYSFSQGVWTWMSGSAVANNSGVFGTKGVPSVNNYPPALYTTYCWTDLQGNFWLYGGEGSFGPYGDMWRFNPITLEWTWVNGTGSPYFASSVYGVKGVPSPQNAPGSLSYNGCAWVDANGDLWLFSGDDDLGNLPDDLWKYTIATNEWTWINGDLSYNPAAYGTKGTASASNNPGGRQEMGSPWVDNNGKFWLYGGGDNYNHLLNDMWMYDPSVNMWTWESGSKSPNLSPVYGSKGIFSSANTPGGRWPYSMITENNGNFLLFGGAGGPFADLWEYNPTINEWAWISGTKKFSDTGIAGNTCQADTGFYPGGRLENRAAWKDCAGNLWMYGGFNVSEYAFGDIWVYLSATKQWARMSNSSYLNKHPVYGILGVPALTNQPGAKGGPAHWKDSKGNLWIFGGLNLGSSTFYGDVWRYQPDYSCIHAYCGCASSAGIVTGSRDSICYGTGVTSHLSVSGNTGHTQWESSTDGVNFTTIAGDTLSTYTTPPSLAQTTYYCITSTDSCTAISNVVAVHIVPAPSTSITYSANGKQYNFQPDSVTGGVVSYHWDFGDGKTSNEINPVHTFDSVKTYYVCLTVYNRSNCSFTRCQYVSAPNGIQNSSAAQIIRLYPNPANEGLTVEVLNSAAPKQITVTDDLGRTLIQLNTLKIKTQIDIHVLAAGIYFVKTQLADGSMQVNKLVKE